METAIIDNPLKELCLKGTRELTVSWKIMQDQEIILLFFFLSLKMEEIITS